MEILVRKSTKRCTEMANDQLSPLRRIISADKKKEKKKKLEVKDTANLLG